MWRQRSFKAYQISAVSSPEGSLLINLPEVICRSQLQIAQPKIAPHFPCVYLCVCSINQNINIGLNCKNLYINYTMCVYGLSKRKKKELCLTLILISNSEPRSSKDSTRGGGFLVWSYLLFFKFKAALCISASYYGALNMRANQFRSTYIRLKRTTRV